MPEHPMLFDPASVRGLLDGTKTQTRRLLKPQPHPGIASFMPLADYWKPAWGSDAPPAQECVKFNQALRPPHPAGTRIWVRERWRVADHDFAEPPSAWLLEGEGGSWWANPPEEQRAALAEKWGTAQTMGGPDPRWRPSIHMPRWASRIVLEVVSVKLERVNAISPGDAQAEGICEPCHGCNPGVCRQPGPVCTVFLYSQVLGFQRRWDEIHGPGAWDEGEWVWVYGLRRVKPLADLPAAPARPELRELQGTERMRLWADDIRETLLSELYRRLDERRRYVHVCREKGRLRAAEVAGR